jgi:hypothetical protein
MCSDQPGAETLKGLRHPSLSLAAASGWSQAGTDRYSEAPTPWRVTAGVQSVGEEFG